MLVNIWKYDAKLWLMAYANSVNLLQNTEVLYYITKSVYLNH